MGFREVLLPDLNLSVSVQNGPTAHPLGVEILSGYIDFYGFHAGASGWFLCGWITEGWQNRQFAQIRLEFEDGGFDGPYDIATFERDDVRGRGVGLLLFVYANSVPLGALRSAATLSNGPRSILLSSNPVHYLKNPSFPTDFATI